MAKRVAVISLYPLSQMGGGEMYTLNAALSVASDATVDVFAPVHKVPDDLCDYEALSRCQFTSVLLNGSYNSGLQCTFSALCKFHITHDIVWIHQYLSNLLFYMLITSIGSTRPVILTSHGHEPHANTFHRRYQPLVNHHFVEVSLFSASRTVGKLPTKVPYISEYAGTWHRNVQPARNSNRKSRTMGLNIAAIGRVLPHKGFETIIAALRPSDSLHILGPLEHEDPYYKYLMNERTMGSVTFHGPVSEKTKGTFLQECDVLVSASTTSLYDGRTIEQSELLGIVLFEAVAQGKIPFVSNQPAFVEVMELFDGLQYVFPQNDAAALRSLFDKYEQLSADELMDTTRDMQQRLRKKGCFDNYWRRIIKRLDGAC